MNAIRSSNHAAVVLHWIFCISKVLNDVWILKLCHHHNGGGSTIPWILCSIFVHPNGALAKAALRLFMASLHSHPMFSQICCSLDIFVDLQPFGCSLPYVSLIYRLPEVASDVISIGMGREDNNIDPDLLCSKLWSPKTQQLLRNSQNMCNFIVLSSLPTRRNFQGQGAPIPESAQIQFKA